jgi:F-type H+-transporting ATPase subunit b
MRIRRFLLAGVLAGAVLVTVAVPASAESPGTEQGKKLVECVEKALSDNKADIAKQSYDGFTNALEDCHKAPSLITPATNEIIWGGIAFLIVAFALMKFAFPMIKKSLAARQEKIRGDLEGAERARAEAEAERTQYTTQLADARSEANRILEEARQATEQVRAELLARAETEAAEIRQRAQEDARLAGERALSDLKAQVAGLSVDLAERIVEHNLDRDTQLALVESYIASVGATGNRGA